MSDKKYCPMQFCLVGRGLETFSDTTCFQEKCQWWYPKTKECVVEHIAWIAENLRG